MRRSLVHLAIALSFVVLAGRAAAVPPLINFQGTLTDSVGAPLASGTYTIEFRVWNTPVAGESGEQLVWGRVYDAPVANGRFNVILGDDSGTAIDGAAVNDISYAFAGDERYVGITPTHVDGVAIEAPQELAPRQQVLSAPYAVQAKKASHHSNVIPVGTVFAYWGDSPPTGWILCDGAEIPADTDYDALRTLIGANKPDLRGRALIGAGQGSGLSNRLLGSTLGTQTHTLTWQEIPDHGHDVTDPGHFHTFVKSSSDSSGAYVDYGDSWTRIQNTSTETTGITIPASGGDDQPHNNMPPSAVVNFIIKY